MPEHALSAMNEEHALVIARLAMAMEHDDSDEEELADSLFLRACEELGRNLYQEVGHERLSLERLMREHEEHQCEGTPWDVKQRFNYTLEELPSVIEAFDLPAGFTTRSGHVFTGEEGLLLMLLRFRTADNLVRLTKYTGRSTSAISEGVLYIYIYI